MRYGNYKFVQINMKHLLHRGVIGCHFTIKIAFLSMKIVFVLANSTDPDEMWHNAQFHLGQHCLSKYAFMSLSYTKADNISFIY